MSAVCAVDCPERASVLAAFYAQWKADPNVMNKWFSMQVRWASVVTTRLLQVAAGWRQPWRGGEWVWARQL